MKKSESILRLEAMGLNTLDYRIIETKSEVLHYLAKHANDKLSLRTERGDEFNCPFYYMMTGESLINQSLGHLEEGYKLIFAPSLSIDECIAFGNVGLSDSQTDVMEFVIGKGKVRDLDNHPDRHSILIQKPSLVPFKFSDFGENTEMLNSIYKKVYDICYTEIPCVVEWSYYKHPVGVLGTNDIYWEIRFYA